jgi:hypothetical protein
MWASIEHFAGRLSWLNLGGGRGVRVAETDGLACFKQGWSTGSRTAYLCGAVLDGDVYRGLVQAKHRTPSIYFPAYRAPEAF